MTVARDEQERRDNRRGGGRTRRDNGQGKRRDGRERRCDGRERRSDGRGRRGDGRGRRDDGRVACLLKQVYIFHKKLFIPQTRLNLVCGISLFCKNNGPITSLFIFTNDKIMPTAVPKIVAPSTFPSIRNS